MVRHYHGGHMRQRINTQAAPPEALKGMFATEAYLKQSSLPAGLLHMLKLRASQMNGCAYCIDMHWKDARAAGESEQRLYGLSTWRESPYYTDRERAALAWVESITDLHDGHVSDAVYDAVRAQFSEKEVADLTWAAAGINAWNRVAIASRAAPGKYRPGQHG